MTRKERTPRDSMLEDYCFAKGIEFEPARFTVTDAELFAWVNEPSLEEDAKLLTRDVERARQGDRASLALLEALGLTHLLSEDV